MEIRKKAEHIHKKYSAIRKRLQKKGKYRLLKKIRDRESRIVRDLNHKISKKIVEIAEDEQTGIKLERLKGIRKNKKYMKSFNYVLNSWSFYQFENFVQYKAKMNGIPVTYVDAKTHTKSVPGVEV